MTKIIFFDIDGTLVPANKGIIESSSARAIREVRENGIKVCIASGRAIQWIDNLGDMEFDGYVTANGSMCLLGDKRTPIWMNAVAESDMKRLEEFSRHTDLPIVAIPAQGPIITTRINDDMQKALDALCISNFEIAPLSSLPIGVPVIQLMAFGSEDERRDSGLLGNVLRQCHATSWNPHFCDILPDGSDKSVGIAKMAEYYGIDIKDTMAFGDGANDIGMLKSAGIGIAMGNAAQKVKEAADWVTTPDNQEGVLNAFRHFSLLP